MTRSEYVEDGVQPGKELNVIPISSLLFSSLLFTSTELFLSRTLAKSNKIFLSHCEIYLKTYQLLNSTFQIARKLDRFSRHARQTSEMGDCSKSTFALEKYIFSA